jgi:uncharacterized Zn finger protein
VIDGGAVEKHKRSQRWLALFRERGLIRDEAALVSSGLRIKRLEMSSGQITAAVSDDEIGACDVVVELPIWQDEQWASAIDSLSRQALFVAQMLAGDMPDELEQALQAEGLALLPAQHETVTASCSCCEQTSRPCRHVSIVLQNAGDMLADDPWLLFVLRGRVRQQVLRALRRKREQNGSPERAGRTGHTPQIGSGSAFGDRQSAQHMDADARPLVDEIQSFWGSARAQEQFRPHIVPPAAQLVLLRRLGPPSFSHANGEVFDALSSIYQQVSETALALAYADDPPAEADEAESTEQELDK